MKFNFRYDAIFILICTSVSFTQSTLFIPLNIQRTYEKGIRSVTGAPGVNYWQNNSDYKIDVRFTPSKSFIEGSEEITYHNNSPDTLKKIVLRVYQDIFKEGAPRDWNFDPEGLTDGIVFEKILINNSEVDLDSNEIFSRSGTNASIKLDDPLLPETSLNFNISWHYTVSVKNRLRGGEYDSTSYFISYWYPQISVYDDIDGWDVYNYSGSQEFYNDLNSYEVNITLPGRFCVWATGELQNAEDFFEKKYLKRFNEAHLSDSVINIITKDDLNEESIFRNQSGFNTWKFKAANVRDFAFGLSDHYLWDGVSLVVDSSSGRRVFIDAAYRITSEDFYIIAKTSRKVISYFSLEMPGVAFPYPCQTVFNGGESGGMEHPMIVNNGSYKLISSAIGVAAHEISHQYFPFYMGINEKKYAFMDEGWAVMLPIAFQERQEDIYDRRLRTVKIYEEFAGNETELPPMIPSVFLTGTAYRSASYNRSGLAYYFLQDMLGEELFKKTLDEFIKRWNGKHPDPFDMFFTFNNVTGQNLNWYWKPWFFDNGFPDLKLDRVEKKDEGYSIKIIKAGEVPVPLRINISFEDNSKDEIYYNASIWKDGNDNYKVNYKTEKFISEVRIGGEDIPDVNAKNNFIAIH